MIAVLAAAAAWLAVAVSVALLVGRAIAGNDAPADAPRPLAPAQPTQADIDATWLAAWEWARTVDRAELTDEQVDRVFADIAAIEESS